MRVCFFLGGLIGGGIGRVTALLANSLSAVDGFDVYVMCYYKNSNEYYSLNKRVNKAYLLENRTSMSNAILHGAVKELRRYLTANRIDIVVGCGVLYSSLAILAAHNTDTITVNWEHSSLSKLNKDFKFQKLVRYYSVKKADYNLVLTKDTKNKYLVKYHLNSAKLFQIYNPVDPNAFVSKKYNVDSIGLITVGRLCFQKRLEDIIYIARELKNKKVNFFWDIYGEGEEKSRIDSLIKENNLSEYVHLMGRVDDIYYRYGEYAGIVMTSRYEGFPMTLLEAAANRLPMISYDIETGPNEIIIDGTNGFIITAGDILQTSNILETFLSNRELRIATSSSSYNTSKDYSINVIVREWIDFLIYIFEERK